MLAHMTASPEQQWVPEWSLADRLRRIRRELGLSQERFAELLDVKPPRYGAWETGRNHPDNVVELARRIEDVAGVPAAWTLGVYSESPRPAGGPNGGLSVVRHQGLEPRTRWFDGCDARVYEFTGNEVHDPYVHRWLAPVVEASHLDSELRAA